MKQLPSIYDCEVCGKMSLDKGKFEEFNAGPVYIEGEEPTGIYFPAYICLDCLKELPEECKYDGYKDNDYTTK